MRTQSPRPPLPRATLPGLLALAALPAVVRAAPQEDPRLERLCAVLEAKRVEYRVPGLAIAVVEGGEVVLARGFGLADLEEGTPVTADTVFPIGSSSKPFTATLIAMLVSEGKLRWDDPIQDYLPELELKIDTDDAEARVTIRDLLAHRTGIDESPILADFFRWWRMDGTIDEDPETWTREQLLAAFLELEATRPFRQAHAYSNCSMVAAGLASGVAAESDWDSLMTRRMFEPLGMASSSTLFARTSEHPRLATGYLLLPGKPALPLPYYSLDAVSPAGGISSSAHDLGLWLRLLTNGGRLGEESLVGERELEEMWTGQIEAVALQVMIPGVQYGLGWMVHEWHGHRVVEHGGNGYGFSANVALMPELGVGFALLSNALPNPLQVELGALVWEALVGEQ